MIAPEAVLRAYPRPPMARITIELFGIARRRAGLAAADIDAATLGEALRALAARHPLLEGEVVRDGAVVAPWRVSLEGIRFLTDGAEPLVEGTRLVVLSSLAGG